MNSKFRPENRLTGHFQAIALQKLKIEEVGSKADSDTLSTSSRIDSACSPQTQVETEVTTQRIDIQRSIRNTIFLAAAALAGGLYGAYDERTKNEAEDQRKDPTAFLQEYERRGRSIRAFKDNLREKDAEITRLRNEIIARKARNSQSSEETPRQEVTH